ncbi:hypothetical protein QUB68_09940 [Microcoleus sp. A006_D1]|uniref:hypothetical protein n=1 Tax=Microcoleus sp. A006_D1 TaxID=3055267 RepID=UPI002FD16211
MISWELLAELKSLVNQSQIKNRQLSYSPIAGDRTIRRSTVPTAPGAISQS